MLIWLISTAAAGVPHGRGVVSVWGGGGKQAARSEVFKLPVKQSALPSRKQGNNLGEGNTPDSSFMGSGDQITTKPDYN